MSAQQPDARGPGRPSQPRVAVLFGGRSSEHAVSCVTAAGVLGAIDKDKYEVIPIGIAKSGQWVLASRRHRPVVPVPARPLPRWRRRTRP